MSNSAGWRRGLRGRRRWRFVASRLGTLDAPRGRLVATIVTVVAGAVVAEASLTIVLKALIARAIVVSGSVVSWPVIPGPVVSRPVVPESVIAGTIISRAVVSGPIVSGSVVPGSVERPTVGPILALLALASLEPVMPIALRLGSLGLRRLGGLGVGRLVLEIDVVARDELVAPDDLGQGPLRLHGAHHPEVMLGVLEVVLRHDAIAGGVGVAGELLVALVNVLGGAAHLDAIGAVGIEGAIGVVLGPSAPTAAVPVTAALAFHSLEVSHFLS